MTNKSDPSYSDTSVIDKIKELDERLFKVEAWMYKMDKDPYIDPKTIFEIHKEEFLKWKSMKKNTASEPTFTD